MRLWRRKREHYVWGERVLKDPAGLGSVYEAVCTCGWKGHVYSTPAEAELEAMEHDPVWRKLPGYAEARARLRLLIEEQRSFKPF